MFALVDGIQYQQHTGDWIEPNPKTAVALFAGTQDEPLAHAGPWLVIPEHAREHGVDLNDLEQARPGVIWLIGWLDIGTQAAKLRAIAKAVEIYAPFYVMFGPRKYFMKAVFEDRPGVSWMLYLPRALTMQQVPEARDLIPVMIDGKQKGTIIVSVTDGVFSVDNAEHVKVANAIEVRLVDQDLLPRFVDL